MLGDRLLRDYNIDPVCSAAQRGAKAARVLAIVEYVELDKIEKRDCAVGKSVSKSKSESFKTA